ncbi:MAG TPA: AraC family transcriptional regulator ligand-binding domain-containing protein [Chryseosolibacter sp.]
MTDQQRQLLLAFCGYAALRDLPIHELASRAAIDIDKVLNSANHSVSRDQVYQLIRFTADASGDQHFGMHFGESLQLGALGVVGEIIKSSTTVGEAIQVAASLTPLVTDLFTMEVRKDVDIAVRYCRTDSPADAIVEKFWLDFVLVFTVHELDGLLLRKVKPKSMTLRGALHDEYERVLRCRPERADQIEIVLDGSYWEESIITGNYEVQRELLAKVGMPAQPVESFQVKVMEFLTKNSYLGILTLEDVASNFMMTPRSIQRRLQEESTSFQQIADAVRKSLAIHYLQSGKYQLKEISYFLGYNELSAFSRAFKRWTGKAPNQYMA